MLCRYFANNGQSETAAVLLVAEDPIEAFKNKPLFCGRYAWAGPGIPPAEQRLVFERFYRVLGNKQNGSGLGLAIVREIAAQHGATVSVCFNPQSTDTRWPGSRFAVSFDPAVPRG